MNEQVYYSDTRGNNLFGYRVEDDEAVPHFRKGDVALINPNLSPRNGDFVVARGSGKCMLRLYVEGASGSILVAPSGMDVPVAADSLIILGRVVERRRSYKR